MTGFRQREHHERRQQRDKSLSGTFTTHGTINGGRLDRLAGLPAGAIDHPDDTVNPKRPRSRRLP